MSAVIRWVRAWRMARAQDAMMRMPLAARVAAAREGVAPWHWPYRLTQFPVAWGERTEAARD